MQTNVLISINETKNMLKPENIGSSITDNVFCERKKQCGDVWQKTPSETKFGIFTQTTMESVRPKTMFGTVWAVLARQSC